MDHTHNHNHKHRNKNKHNYNHIYQINTIDDIDYNIITNTVDDVEYNIITNKIDERNIIYDHIQIEKQCNNLETQENVVNDIDDDIVNNIITNDEYNIKTHNIDDNKDKDIECEYIIKTNNIEIIPDYLGYFKNLFDKVIEEDYENEEIFKCMIIKHGIKIVFSLTKLINYKEYRKIYEKALKIYSVLLFNPISSKLPLEIVFGCRNPLSKGIGRWDGAYIVLKGKGEYLKEYTFINYTDTHKESYDIIDSTKLYYEYIKKKWIPMTITDIIETANININKDTITTPIKYKNNRNRNISLFIGSIVSVLGILIKNKNRNKNCLAQYYSNPNNNLNQYYRPVTHPNLNQYYSYPIEKWTIDHNK